MPNQKPPVKTSSLNWDKFKDVSILFLLGLAIRIFSSNMEELNKSVTDLNAKVGVVIATTQTHEKEIDTLRTQVRELEIKVGPENIKEATGKR